MNYALFHCCYYYNLVFIQHRFCLVSKPAIDNNQFSCFWNCLNYSIFLPGKLFIEKCMQLNNNASPKLCFILNLCFIFIFNYLTSGLVYLLYSECSIIWHPPSQSQLIRCLIMNCHIEWIVKLNTHPAQMSDYI